jgi:flagellar biosynthesis protein FlhB
MKKIFLIINILNFYIYQFVDKHKKILPTYPTDVTSEKILGFLLTILCLTIFLIVDKLYPLKVEYVFAFIIPLCLLHYYALIYKKRWVHYMYFIKKQPQEILRRWKFYVCIIFLSLFLLLILLCIIDYKY